MINFEDIVADINRISEYDKKILDLNSKGFQTDCIEDTVLKAVNNIEEGNNSFVIYGEPQCGKTELMVALTAKLIDKDNKIIIILLNDDTDLLNQNLQRFQSSAINPTPINYTEILDENVGTRNWIIFCKKNAKDLFKLHNKLSSINRKIIIDDEGDYASPNGKINANAQTKINELISQLISNSGIYIGVTATPARLDLNNTFENVTENWVKFRAHDNYVGKDIFFPVNKKERLQFGLKKLPETGDRPDFVRTAIANFIVNTSILNTIENLSNNYSFLIHTSREVDEHTKERKDVVKYLDALIDKTNKDYEKYWKQIIEIINKKSLQREDSEKVFHFAYNNITNQCVTIINSRNKNNVGVNTTAPTSIFSIFIGGNKVSRGITFGNLLGMFFARDAQKIQQDTYIQRARMFGNRRKYLKYFELWITESLYNDWRRCFVYHYLSLLSIEAKSGAPVWIGDQRIRPVASTSIDKRTLVIEKGEMAFPKFRYKNDIKALLSITNKKELLEKLHKYIGGECFPIYIYEFILNSADDLNSDINILPCRFVPDTTEYHKDLYRKQGILGGADLKKYGVHKLMIVHNSSNEARLIYYFDGKVDFFKNGRSES